MRTVVCTRERFGVPLGTVVEIEDDAEVSPLYYAELGSLEALAAEARIAEAAAAREAASSPPPEPPAAEEGPADIPVTPLTLQPVPPLTGAPDATAGE